MIEDVIYEAIKLVQKDKESRNLHPTNVTKTELLNSVKEAVNILVRQGRVRIGETINDKYIELL